MQSDVLSSGLPFLVALVAISTVFFFSSTNARTGLRILVSLHAVFFAASFLAATTLASFVGRSYGLSLAYVSIQAIGILLMVVSVVKFEGPRYLHALHAFTLVMATLLCLVGGAYVSGDSP